MSWIFSDKHRTFSLNAFKPREVLLTTSVALGLVACGSSDFVFAPPNIPAAKSAIVAPELTTSCPIVASYIESFVTKGTGPAFNGAQFGAVGSYKYILAEATGKVNANDPCISTIVDLINSADASGLVTYKFDVVMLTPTDASKGNGSLLYIVNNRTNSSAFEALNDGSNALELVRLFTM